MNIRLLECLYDKERIVPRFDKNLNSFNPGQVVKLNKERSMHISLLESGLVVGGISSPKIDCVNLLMILADTKLLNIQKTADLQYFYFITQTGNVAVFNNYWKNECLDPLGTFIFPSEYSNSKESLKGYYDLFLQTHIANYTQEALLKKGNNETKSSS